MLTEVKVLGENGVSIGFDRNVFITTCDQEFTPGMGRDLIKQFDRVSALAGCRAIPYIKLMGSDVYVGDKLSELLSGADGLAVVMMTTVMKKLVNMFLMTDNDIPQGQMSIEIFGAKKGARKNFSAKYTEDGADYPICTGKWRWNNDEMAFLGGEQFIAIDGIPPRQQVCLPIINPADSRKCFLMGEVDGYRINFSYRQGVKVDWWRTKVFINWSGSKNRFFKELVERGAFNPMEPVGMSDLIFPLELLLNKDQYLKHAASEDVKGSPSIESLAALFRPEERNDI